MDSYVLAELFKYLYLLFSEDSDIPVQLEDYIFTTEAHLLPLSIARLPRPVNPLTNVVPDSVTLSNVKPISLSDNLREGDGGGDDLASHDYTCPNINYVYSSQEDFASVWRAPLEDLVMEMCPKPKTAIGKPLRASDFIAGNEKQAKQLEEMGIRVITLIDGRVQLLHSSNLAQTAEYAEHGLDFMQEMIEYTKQQEQQTLSEVLRFVQFGDDVLKAGRAQFGPDLATLPAGGVVGPVMVADPFRLCHGINNGEEIQGHIVVVERGDCMFIDKARLIQRYGAIGGIVIDSISDSTSDKIGMFAMSGDGSKDITIPMLFLYQVEGKQLLNEINLYYQQQKQLLVRMGSSVIPLAQTDNGTPDHITLKEIEETDGVLTVNVEKIHLLSPVVNTLRDTQLVGYHMSDDEGDDGSTVTAGDIFVRYSTTADSLGPVLSVKLQEAGEVKSPHSSSTGKLVQKVVSRISKSGEMRGEVMLERDGKDQVSILLTVPPSSDYLYYMQTKLEDIRSDTLSHILTLLTTQTNFNTLTNNGQYVEVIRRLVNVLLGEDEIFDYQSISALHSITEELLPISQHTTVIQVPTHVSGVEVDNGEAHMQNGDIDGEEKGEHGVRRGVTVVRAVDNMDGVAQTVDRVAQGVDRVAQGVDRVAQGVDRVARGVGKVEQIPIEDVFSKEEIESYKKKGV